MTCKLLCLIENVKQVFFLISLTKEDKTLTDYIQFHTKNLKVKISKKNPSTFFLTFEFFSPFEHQ